MFCLWDKYNTFIWNYKRQIAMKKRPAEQTAGRGILFVDL